MKKFSTILVCSLFAANLAVTAQAADYGSPGMAMEKMKGDGMMMGKHKMTGTVDKIDHAKGTLVLKTGMADMSLHFPPPSVKDLKNGDTITVELGFTKGEPPMK
ncbi:MAG: hypothetical protein ABFE02_16215 [Sulfuricella sp.]